MSNQLYWLQYSSRSVKNTSSKNFWGFVDSEGKFASWSIHSKDEPENEAFDFSFRKPAV